MTEEQERALQEFKLAGQQVAKCLPFRGGGAGAEKKYSQAYQHCVRLGLFMPLKKKYR